MLRAVRLVRPSVSAATCVASISAAPALPRVQRVVLPAATATGAAVLTRSLVVPRVFAEAVADEPSEPVQREYPRIESLSSLGTASSRTSLSGFSSPGSGKPVAEDWLCGSSKFESFITGVGTGVATGLAVSLTSKLALTASFAALSAHMVFGWQPPAWLTRRLASIARHDDEDEGSDDDSDTDDVAAFFPAMLRRIKVMLQWLRDICLRNKSFAIGLIFGLRSFF